MQIPQSITLSASAYRLDGGTMTLHAVTEAGTKCTIQLNQRVFDSYADPGRLYFNEEPVEVRSDTETQIINLLRTASIAAIKRQAGPPENRISKNALILGDDIKEVMGNSPENNLRKFRDDIIAFVESDEYVQIAKNGIPKRK